MIQKILTSLLILITGIFGTSNNPVRLQKKPTMKDRKEKFNCWIERNFGIIALIIMLFALISFVIVCYLVVGVSAVESGNYYNHLGGVI